jgi:Secretion system C-terminal sorting domain/Ig-like domain CHU_C associated
MKKITLLLFAFIMSWQINAQTNLVAGVFGNATLINFPTGCQNLNPAVSSSAISYRSLVSQDDNRFVFTSNNSSAVLDTVTAPYLQIAMDTNKEIDFDRFTLMGYQSTGPKTQLRWSVDNYATSLGEFSSLSAFTRTSCDLSSKPNVPAGIVTFRIYFYFATGSVYLPDGGLTATNANTAANYYLLYKNLAISGTPVVPTICNDGQTPALNTVNNNTFSATYYVLNSFVASGNGTMNYAGFNKCTTVSLSPFIEAKYRLVVYDAKADGTPNNLIGYTNFINMSNQEKLFTGEVDVPLNNSVNLVFGNKYFIGINNQKSSALSFVSNGLDGTSSLYFYYENPEIIPITQASISNGSFGKYDVFLKTVSTPKADAQQFCGSATVADLVATGTDLKWYDVATGGTALNNANPLSSSTYYVASESGTCKSTRTAVNVTINTIPAAPTATSPQTFSTIAGATIASLAITASGSVINWYDAAIGGNNIGTSTILVNGNSYYVSQITNGCESARVKVTVNLVAPFEVNPSTATICNGETITLTTANALSNPTTSGKIGSGTIYNQEIFFNGAWGNSKSQSLYTAAELTALGLVSGSAISSIGFVMEAGSPTATFNDFNLSVALVSQQTIANPATNFIPVASTLIFSSPSYTPNSAGGNIDFPLTTPLVWDGTSALVVQGCFSNSNSGNSATGFRKLECSFYGTPNERSVNTLVDGSTNGCSANFNSFTIKGSNEKRPNLRLSFAQTSTITWSPITDLYTDAAATTAYNFNANASTVYAKPVVNRTYTATSTNGLTSANASSVITVNPKPEILTTQNGAGCQNDIITISATATAGSTLYWFYDSAELNGAGTGPSKDFDELPLGVNTLYVKAILNGCSSALVPVTVTVTPKTELLTTAKACASYTWSANSQTYTTSGIYSVVNGCETKILDLTINPSSDNITTVSACGSYTWNGTTYTTSGIKTGTTTNCVTEKLDLTINPSPTNAQLVITRLGDTLTVAVSGAVYQWYQIVNQVGVLIPNATNQSYSASTSGSYYVEVNLNGCIAEADFVTLNNLGISDFDANTSMKVYPNPFNNIVNISIDSNATLEVYDLVGKQIQKQKIENGFSQIDLSNYSSGVYMMKVTNENNQTKTLKVIKK